MKFYIEFYLPESDRFVYTISHGTSKADAIFSASCLLGEPAELCIARKPTNDEWKIFKEMGEPNYITLPLDKFRSLVYT